MCLAQGPQRSDAGEVSSQALYHWATALPGSFLMFQGIQTSIAKQPYNFVMGSGPPAPPLDQCMAAHNISAC